jgi:hypothetical protein
LKSERPAAWAGASWASAGETPAQSARRTTDDVQKERKPRRLFMSTDTEAKEYHGR